MDYEREQELLNRIARLEGALRVFAELGRELKSVADFPAPGLGIVKAGESARSSVSWRDFQKATDAFYGEGQ